MTKLSVIKHFTTSLLAKRLHLKEQTLRHWRMIGCGPKYIRIGGRRGRCLYRLEDVEAWEAQRIFSNTTEEAQKGETIANSVQAEGGEQR